MVEIVRLIPRTTPSPSSKAGGRKRYLEYEDLTGEDWALALHLWAIGHDTLDIARKFEVPEFVIYNGISRHREITDG